MLPHKKDRSSRFLWSGLQTGSLLNFFFLGICLLSGCTPAAHKQLIVGMELAFPPFETTDAKGTPAGISVDLAKALGRHLHRETVIENIPFAGLIPALKTGKIDVIISSMTATPERAQSIDFSDPYLKTGLCLLVGRNSQIQSIADADTPQTTLAVKRGTTGNLYATQHIRHARVLVLDDETACVLEVVQGKVNGFIYDQISTFDNWQKHSDSTRAILNPFQTETWAIGIRKGNNDLREKVNQFLADFRASGGFDDLGNRYLKKQKDAFKDLGIPFYF
jgi:polar amino acid transport system substrate-binding protein